MKILYIHNNYLYPSGEEQAAEAIVNLLQEKGHEVNWYRRSSVELDGMFMGRLRALFLSCYNPKASNEIKRIILNSHPDLVQVQNLYPLISPRILKTIKSTRTPVIMRCPNYRLFCPTGLFFDSNGSVCEKCTDQGHEIWCIRKNCTGSIVKSVAYALRNFIARISGVFLKYTEIIIVQSEFQRKKFIKLGVPDDKIEVLPGITPAVTVSSVKSNGSYITFAGRVSSEKGIDDFLSAAERLPNLKFVVAGKVTDDVYYEKAPVNVIWKGSLNAPELDELYSQSAVIVVPSRWYEGFPNVITRAMHHSKPVITTNLGCFPDIIDQGINGFMYQSGNIESLVSTIQWIIKNPAEAIKIGLNGHDKAERQYSREVIYGKLMKIYSRALEMSERKVEKEKERWRDKLTQERNTHNY